MSQFMVRKWANGDVSVYQLKSGVAIGWNPKERRWVSTNSLGWTGMGGDWAEWDSVTVEEAAAKLRAQGVAPEELEEVMLGLNPDDSPVARVLIESNRQPTTIEPTALTVGNRTYRL